MPSHSVQPGGRVQHRSPSSSHRTNRSRPAGTVRGTTIRVLSNAWPSTSSSKTRSHASPGRCEAK
uniref:Uncharacterized protein n=1 Tax=uncultured marine virus TaxID=186617 RepID=A0A0F7L3U2_9VIRU|nr:hypothetical protein [uncultured marine virus]